MLSWATRAVGDDHPFGDVELEPVRFDPVVREDAGDGLGVVGIRQVPGGQVDRQAHGGQACFTPPSGLGAGLLEHPGVQGDDGVAALGDGHEDGRLEHAVFGVVPAQEGLDAHHLGGAQVDVGLEHDEELVAPEGTDEVPVEGPLVEAGRRSGRGPEWAEYIWNRLRPRLLARYMASSARLSRSS